MPYHTKTAELSTINLPAARYTFDEYCIVADLTKDTLHQHL